MTERKPYTAPTVRDVELVEIGALAALDAIRVALDEDCDAGGIALYNPRNTVWKLRQILARAPKPIEADPTEIPYVISDDDVLQATRVASAAIVTATGAKPLVVTIAGCVMLELARVVAGAPIGPGDELTRSLLERFRSAGGEVVIQDMLLELGVTL